MNSGYQQLLLLSMFALVITVRYLISLARGVRPVLILSKKKNFTEKLVEVVPVAGVSLAALLVLRNIFTPHVFPLLEAGFMMPPGLQQAGFTISLLSFLLLVSGYWSLGSNWRVGTGDEECKELVTTGIFSLTRNPVYQFFNLFTLGIFFLNGDYLLLAIFAAVAASLHRLILNEEILLRRHFGNAYEQYARRTPRYFF